MCGVCVNQVDCWFNFEVQEERWMPMCEFIPIAARIGLGRAIDAHVF